MAQNLRSFEVNQPVELVYRRWLHYENLGEFAPQVKSVCKTGERTSHWVVEAMGLREEWDAEVTTMQENRRIAWRSTSGLENRGEVRFEPLGPDRTRVTVDFEYQLLGHGESPDEAEEEMDRAEQEVRATLERKS
jgi:uncharacterized membrane protein